MVFVVCSVFIIAYFVPVGTLLAAQPEDEWVAQPMHIIQLSGSSDPPGYSPAQIRVAYGLPSSGGAGTTIAIIDAYNTSSIWNDLTVFSTNFSLPLPTASNFEIYNMSTNIGTNSNWTTETCLDVEWAHAIAPDAKILLVEAVNNTRSSLLSAIDYATSHGVVAVSMSWGSAEDFSIKNYDSHFNKPGIIFFASSGDNGSGSRVSWPASSPNVVAVGGTTLNLNTTDGTVISETAWNGSGGGMSAYEPKPAYQISYGVPYANRSVPDVSYDGDPQTGVAVYCNSQWYIIGGTSAGAPQWAAIHALGLSATNTNLYQKAKLDYSSYFRDITNGSNGLFNATSGYDLVTGLGSPLTYNFGTYFTVSPTSGPANGSITLNGIGFTANSSVNISYLNPITSAWVSVNNLTTTSTQSFTYPFNAPDLLQNNTAGDNQPLSDNIVFRAQDNSNGHSYNATVPYAEWRRGLTQVADQTATRLYGNNTNLATSAFVQSGQSIIVAGEWFSPGSASLLWDGTISLGTVSTDANGFFNASVLVPATTAGQHTLTINDGASNFCVNLTRVPAVTNNYDGSWHTSDLIINLTPDSNVNETFYSINNGPICNVTANGQPVITTEGSNNTLEYWSTWYSYETGTMELPHVTLTGIQVDKTPPTGSITTSNNIVNSATVTLSLYATDNVSRVAQMRFSNDNTTWSNWESYSTSKTWTLQDGDGQKTVTVQYMDNAGLISSYNCTIILSNPQSSPNASPSATTSPSSTQTPSASPTPSATPSESQSSEPSATPAVPELSIQMILVLLATATISLAVAYKSKAPKNPC
jgi:hypothetical protein